jgi:hypothetical protein
LKTTSQFLWQLVHSLSNSEKLYFKRNYISSASSASALYIKLFDAIALQKEYNEPALLKKLHPSLNKKNIASQKHYLQQLICEAVIQYDGRNNIGQEIYNQLLLIRLYRKKGLLDQAHTCWKKAVSKARQVESFALLSLLKTEFEKMILISSTHISYDELHSLFVQNTLGYSDYADMITLRDIYAETILIKRKSHFDLGDELREKVKEMLLQVNKYSKAADSNSFWYRHYYFMCKAALLYLLNNTTDSFRLLIDVHRLWQNNKDFIQTHCEHYLELLYMINYTGIVNSEYEYILNTFSNKINDKINDPVQRANFEAIKYVAHNRVYNKRADYEEVKKLIVHMKSKYRQWEPLLNTDMNKTVNLSLGIASFALDQYGDAMYFTKRAIDYFKDGTREEHSIVAQILLLLTVYNMNNARLFDAQYKNTYAFFYKRKKKQPCETALLQCLHRTFYMTNKKDKLKEYGKVVTIIEEHKDNRVLQNIFSIFNYPGWLTSRLQGLSYRQYVERKVKAETNN